MKNIKKLLTLLTILLFVSCTTEVIKYIYIDPTTGEQIDPDKLPGNGITPDNPSTNDPSDKPSDNPSEDPSDDPSDDPTEDPSDDPAEYIRTTSSTVTLPDSPANSAFDMIAISFTDGRATDEIILGEETYCKKSSASYNDTTYRTDIKPFKMSKYMVSYNTWYYVYQWAINNGYKFINKGCEGMYAEGISAGAYYKFNEGGVPQVEEMPAAGMSWRDTIIWCNALSQMKGLTPVYYSDEAFTTPLKDSTQSTTEFTDTNWDKTPGKIDNPYVNQKANGYRLPYTAEWEYAARKKKNGTCIQGRNIPGDESGSFYDFDDTDKANGFNFVKSTAVGNYMWYRYNAGGSGGTTASGKDDSNATIHSKLSAYSATACAYKQGSNRTHLSGGKKPSHLGFYDLSGNLCEWMFEYHIQYGSALKFAPKRECRGTDFVTTTSWTSSGERGAHFPLYTDAGFRICQNN